MGPFTGVQYERLSASMERMHMIVRPPNTFPHAPFGNSWFKWDAIDACFWPGLGRRSIAIDPVLARIANLGGVYLFAWCAKAPRGFGPTLRVIKAIGETGHFKSRM